MKRELRGQSVIITGASRGIGRAIAFRLAAAGVKVGLLARDAAGLGEVCAGIRANGGVAEGLVCDLSELEGLPEALRILRESLGRVDCLINNAGVFLERPLMETGTGAWQEALALNLTAPFVCCRELMPHFVAHGGGRIINIASTAGSQGYLNQSAYCASKHGLLGMSKALAIEARPHGIKVSCISPGGVNTGFIKGTYLGARLEGQVMIEAKDVAESVVHVLEAPDNVEMPELVLRRFSSI